MYTVVDACACGLAAKTGIELQIGDLCGRMYLTCISKLWFRYELMAIIKDGYLMNFSFYKIHFTIQTMPLEELPLVECVDVRLLQ